MKRRIVYAVIIFAASLLLIATASGENVTTQATVSNNLPSVDAIVFYSDVNMTSVETSFNPSPGLNTSVYFKITVSDQNGYADINYTYANLSYGYGNGTLVFDHVVSMSFDSGSNNTAYYIGDIQMSFYDTPAIGNNSYNLSVFIMDTYGNSAEGSSGYNYQELVAINLNTTSINFGSLSMGQNSSIQNVLVQNYGNVKLDLRLSGTNMNRTGGGSFINVSNVYHRNPPANNFVGTTSSLLTFSDFDLYAGIYSTKTTDWKLQAPLGIQAGSYTGTLSFVAIKE